MAEVVVDTALVAPIPVGHRVRVAIYAIARRGLFGASQQALIHEPVIEDLDTGVVYCSEQPFEHDGAKRSGVPVSVGARPLGDPQQVFEGVVRACRVVTVRAFAEVDVQTRLVVETGG